MPEVATAVKPARTVASATAAPAKSLREVQPKTFSPSSLQPLGYGSIEILTICVPAGWTFEDVLNPVAWSGVVGQISANAARTQIDRVGSLIYVTGPDFVSWLHINRIVRDSLNNPCGLEVICMGPAVDVKTGVPCPLNIRTGQPWTDAKKAE